MKKSKTHGDEQTLAKKPPGTPEDPKSPVHLPRPGWKVVQSAVNVPAPKWKTFPTLTALNTSQLQTADEPKASLYSKNFSRPPADSKEAASPTSVVMPRLLKNPGNW